MALINLPPNQLKKGHFINLPLGWKDHPFMFSSFKIKSDEQLTILRSLGLATVQVDEDKSDLPKTAPISQPEPEPEVKAAPVKPAEVYEDPKELASKQAKRGQKQAEKEFAKNLDEFKGALGKFNLSPDEAYFEIAQQVSKTTKQVFSTEEKLPVHMISSNSAGETIFYHGMNVAVLGLLVAKELGFSEEECHTFTLGAMVHDMGELRVPTQIRRKNTPLSKVEQNYLDMHTTYGVDVIKKAGSFPKSIMPLIENHHERLDGSGYPKKLKGDQIDKLTQLLSVVDTFDNLCYPLPFQKPATPRTAIVTLFKNAPARYNKTYLEALVQVMGIYPPGSLVTLSDENYGLVLATNPDNLMNPKVIAYQKGQRPERVPVIDLAQEDLDITGTVTADKLPEKVYEFFDPSSRICFFYELPV